MSKVASIFDDCTCDGVVMCAHCKALDQVERERRQRQELPEFIRQKTFGGAALLDAAEQAAHASFSEIEQAIARLESLKLADLIRKRAALESAMDDARLALKDQQAEWARLQRGISMMIKRGVQS